MESFDERTLYNLGYHVWKVEFSMEGLGALFRVAGDDEFLDRDEMHGIGEIIVLIKNESRKVRRVLMERYSVPEFRKFASGDDLKKMEKVYKNKKKKTNNKGK